MRQTKKDHVDTKPLLVKNLLLIEGHTRAGKFFLGKILCGFDKIEHYQYESIIEVTGHLEMLKFIPRETAKFLLQLHIDECAYNIRVGRKLNFRLSDNSSLLNSFDMARYVRRAFEERPHHEVLSEFRHDGRYSTFVTHESMLNIKLYFETFPHLKVISIIRHPVDVIHSLYMKGWGKREGQDPISMGPCIATDNTSVPWYAFNWAKQYMKMAQMDRIIYMMKNLSILNQKGYQALSPKEKNRILIIKHENIIQKTDHIIKKIGNFLKVNPQKFMPNLLKREGCYRRILPEGREKKIREIKKKASKEIFEEMMALAQDYEKKSESGKWVQ